MFITPTTEQDILDMQDSQKGYRAIYKHSATCPTAIWAKEEVKAVFEEKEYADFPVAYVHVWDNRPLADRVAQHFATKHESPQLLLFKGKKLKKVVNHFSVTKAFLLHTL